MCIFQFFWNIAMQIPTLLHYSETVNKSYYCSNTEKTYYLQIMRSGSTFIHFFLLKNYVRTTIYELHFVNLSPRYTQQHRVWKWKEKKKRIHFDIKILHYSIIDIYLLVILCYGYNVIVRCDNDAEHQKYKIYENVNNNNKKKR